MKRAWAAVAAVLLAVPLTAAVLAGSATPAAALDNGVGRTPALGWSSWSFVRHNPSAANIEATADAMVSSGLAAVGYTYVNVDDFWYVCPGSQGPDVDSDGRWVTDTAKFPTGPNGENGIQVVADYVHSKGLKFGLYVTPGISHQAVAQNTAIEGTPYHAADIATTATEKNYNCKGMVGIDYTKPGAQEFVNSWADQFASWGVDYVKIDGVGIPDVPDIQAWSQALVQTGRPIHLELSNSLAISGAATWKQLANGWRTGGDVECYCGPGGASYPLTDWSHISSRFNQVANWAPYGGPGGFNDYDSIEVGNGVNDGLTVDERRTQMSLWALASSPFILGTDLTNLDPGDLELLKNRSVLAVDQDAIDATRIASTATSQVFAKTEPNKDAIVGLFNTGAAPAVVSTTAAAIGLPAKPGYLMHELWSDRVTESGGTIAADVPPHGVALYRVRAFPVAPSVPPNTTISLSGLGSLVAGQPGTATETFTNNGAQPVRLAQLGLSTPGGWTVTATTPTPFATVDAGASVQATFSVTAPAPTSLFESHPVTATVDYRWLAVPQHDEVTYQVSTSPPVQAPYRTFSSATDGPSAFAQSGTQFGISGAGADLYSSTDAYSAIYLPQSVGATATVDTTVVSQQNMSGFAKAGIIVRNDMTGSGSTPEGVILFESPSGGIQLEWTKDGGTHINTVTPPNGTIPDSLPVHLKLERTAPASYTGYYSLDGQGWYTVGTATVPGQAGTQDAGIFVTSHSSGSPGTVVFDGLTVAAGATPPPGGPTPYEAEATANTLSGGARVASCTACSGGQKVGFLGNGGTLTVGGVTVAAAGDYRVTIAYLDGSATGRQLQVTADNAAPQTVSFTPTGSFNVVGTATITVHLEAGANTISFANPSDFGPDLDRILVASAPS
jgi:hypothetical protein